MTTRIDLAPGLSIPFFPMRPWTGRTVHDPGSVQRLWSEIIGGEWHAQPKLNGDRSLLAVHDGRVLVANRRGSWFKHPVANASEFKQLPNGTVLDGEVYDRMFLPFDALAVGTEVLLNESPLQRELAARQCVKFLGHVWWFFKPTLKWLLGLRNNNPTWEGVVLKKSTSTYQPLGTEGQESQEWKKCKWQA